MYAHVKCMHAKNVYICSPAGGGCAVWCVCVCTCVFLFLAHRAHAHAQAMIQCVWERERERGRERKREREREKAFAHARIHIYVHIHITRIHTQDYIDNTWRTKKRERLSMRVFKMCAYTHILHSNIFECKMCAYALQNMCVYIDFWMYNVCRSHFTFQNLWM